MKSFIVFIVAVCVILPVIPACKASKIVVMYPVGTRSHLMAVMPIVEELARRGHDITVVSPFKLATEKSIHQLYLTDMAAMFHNYSHNWFAMSKQGAKQIFSMLNDMKTMVIKGYESLATNEEFQSLIQGSKIDLFIVNSYFSEFSLIYPDRLKVPFILHGSGSGHAVSLLPMGAPMDYASIPTPLTEFDQTMGFFERLTNALQSECAMIFYNWIVLSPLEERIRRDMPETRALEGLMRKASLLVINSHPATDWPRQLPPSVIPIGALHTRPVQPLTEPFKTFAEESNFGFIVFTLGSLIPVSSMPNETLQAFINAFAKLPQRVFWKWETEKPENIPPNVMMTKWLPQQDLIGHPKAKALISHGGLLSTQEAIYHAVPMIMLPFGNDQKGNAVKARREGFGLKLDWQDIDEEKIFQTIVRLIYDSSFQENATRLSRLMRDELMPAKDIGAYWIEHVLRHKGGQHLQVAGKDMAFYQRYLLDVFSVIAMLLSVNIFLIAFVIYKILKCLFHTSVPKLKKN